MNSVKLYKMLYSEVSKKCMSCRNEKCSISNGYPTLKTLREKVDFVMSFARNDNRVLHAVKTCKKGGSSGERR